MSAATSLSALRPQLLDLLTDDLAAALTALRDLLPDGADKHGQVLALQGRLKDANKERIRNTLAPDEYQRRLDTIRAACYDLISGLEPADLEPPAAPPRPDGKPAPREGSVLYRVPRQMPLLKPAVCTIRVAMDEDAILEDLVLDDDVRLRPRVEVSDMMRAELLDLEGDIFRIVPFSETEQLVREQGYTQWLFRVTPLVPGEHQLLVKVSMMEYNVHLGRYVPREVSVLETVTIVTGDAATDEAAEAEMKATGDRVALGPASKGEGSRTVRAPKQEPAPPPRSKKSNPAGLRALAFSLVFLLVGSAAAWAVVPPPVRDWWVASLRDTPEAYAGYIEKYNKDADPGTRKRLEKAYFRKADQTADPADLRAYATAFAEGGQYTGQVLQKIETLEVLALEHIRAQPEPGAIRQFLQQFPDSKRLNEVAQAAAAKPDVLQQVQAELNQAAAEQTHRRSPAPQTRQEAPQMSPAEAADWVAAEAANTARAYVDFVNKYPKTAKLPEARVRINALKPAMTPEEQAWTDATLANAPQNYIYFLQKYPKSRRTTEARQRIKTFSLSIKDQKRLEAEAAARLAAERVANEQPSNEQPSNPQPSNEQPSNPQPSNPSNRSGLTMVAVQGGAFTMGCLDGRDRDCYDDERPAHTVTLSGFQIGKYEVTQADWRAIMGDNPSDFKNCDDCPVENVSWNDVQDFLKKLNAKYPGKGYRLPTEAEWEYAARGGHKMPGDVSLLSLYAGSNDIGKVAWYAGNSGDKTHPVGGKTPNALGLYDMSGNVYEWCSDWYDDYTEEAQQNPKGPKTGSGRVDRGGSWGGDAQDCRVSRRVGNTPDRRYIYLGFRLASSPQ